MRSVYGRSTIRDKDEQYTGFWAGESFVVYAAGVVWVGLYWGDTIVVVVLPVACMVSGVVVEGVPGAAVVAEACPLNQRGNLRWLPEPRKLYPY